eukprot:CAMPEP_0173059578 /NCGR_PEP_ID=MMETSP1102-20130122/2070_1 /TAXON_ID=49646 /ORGANISM="Geminigera sp., Strain Caron Lab Isolate" /LENGTH=71 /DNA_ID=CAMNT_0013925613 /DNA_START=94 /DNA_END=309 /DNA_ORIENTATION=-
MHSTSLTAAAMAAAAFGFSPSCESWRWRLVHIWRSDVISMLVADVFVNSSCRSFISDRLKALSDEFSSSSV